MKTPNLKNFIAVAWPFFGLAFFLLWGWIYVKPMLPDDFISFEKIKNIFVKEEGPIDPDAKYNFHYVHDGLRPKGVEELMTIIDATVETPKLGVSTTTTVTSVSNTNELQQAIKNANPGDTIELQSGTYKTNIFINKDLTIIGQGTSTVIVGGNSGTAVYAENCKFNLSRCVITDSNSAVKINNSSGTITNMIIKNNKKSGIELRNSRFAIKENIITENGSYGIFADADSEAQIEGNFVADNEGFEVRIEGEREIYR